MSLEDQFHKAAKDIQKASSVSNEDLLSLYSLYKQATVGDVSGSRPGALDFKGRAKYDAWAKQKGSSKEKAMKGYVALVKKLLA